MGIFNKLFKSEKTGKQPRGFHALQISNVRHLCGDTVEITFDIPAGLSSEYYFIPGQYVNVAITINNKEERRSYSLSSSPKEGLTIAIKKVDGGIVSNYLFDNAKTGDELWVSQPEGSFVLPSDAKNVVAFGAGSGITPILSIAKAYDKEGAFRLFYGNRDEEHILYHQELTSLEKVYTTYLLSREEIDGFEKGRIDKDFMSGLIRTDLSLLKADAYLICGPEEMIVAVKESLNLFGVSDQKIIFELFTTPELLKPKVEAPTSDFKGEVQLFIQLDGDVEELTSDEKTTILDAANKAGMDAPYSCRGGVCSSCKCKIIEGSAQMKMNYVLTDIEINDGLLLSCQATPTSSVLKVSFDV